MRKQKSIKKISPVVASSYLNYIDDMRAIKKTEDVIFKRITYILEVVAKTYGVRLDYWYFYNAPEGSHGTLKRERGCLSHCVEFIGNPKKDTDNDFEWVNPAKPKDNYCIRDGVPERWIWEDFEAELKAGKDLADKLRDIADAKRKEKEELKSRAEKEKQFEILKKELGKK